MGMWVEMAGPRVRVVMDLGLELGMNHVSYFAMSLLFAVVADITKKRMLVHRQLFYLAVHGKKMYTEI